MSWADDRVQVQHAIRDRLGTPVGYTPAGDAEVAIEGVFSNEPLVMPLFENVGMQDARPKLFVVLSDLATLGIEPMRGDAVTVEGGDYTVADVVLDGEGAAELFLEVALP